MVDQPNDATARSDAAPTLYGPGPRSLQDHYDARRLADRLGEITVKEGLDERQQAFIGRASYFFLATTDADGFPDVSHKGGRPGFVQIVDEQTLRFPDYDGNGMFRSLGNIVDTGKVALLFIRQDANPVRIRVHGVARVLTDAEATAAFEGAQAVVEVRIGRSFPNCPRYIPDLVGAAPSEFLPKKDTPLKKPYWKDFPFIRGLLSKSDPHK